MAAARTVLVAAGLACLAFEIALISVAAGRPPDPKSDAAQFWFQSERIRNDEALYTPLPDFGPDYMAEGVIDAAKPFPIERFSPYLPLPAAVSALLPRTSLASFQVGLRIVLVAALLGFAAVLSVLSFGRVSIVGMMGWFGLLHFSPGVVLAMRIGNIEPVLWLLFALAVAFPRFLGPGLTTMAAVKPFALWPLLAGAWRNEGTRRAAVLAAAGIVVVCLLALGPADLLATAAAWLRLVPRYMGQGTFAAGNISVSFGVLRVAYATHLWHYQGGPIASVWARGWLTGASVAAPLLAAWLSRRLPLRWAICWVMLAALLFSPLCWDFYLTIGWVPLAMLWRRRAQRASPTDSRRTGDLAGDAA